MMLIYESPEDFAARTTDQSSPHIAAWRAYYRSLVSAGVYVSGAPLQTADNATTVRLRGGKRHVQDGPFADTKEQLGGFIVLELASLDAALDWAARCPAAADGSIEVRPLAPDMHTTITE